MKKINWLLSAMMLFALSFAACGDDPKEPGKKPTPTPAPELTFELDVTETTISDVIFNVTPSDVEADYLSVVVEAKVVNSSESDAAIIKTLYDQIKAAAEANGTTFDAYMAERVKRGALESYKVGGLKSDAKYYLLVFGVDAQNGFATTSKLYYEQFETKAIQQSACTFDIKATVNLTTVALKVTPSNNNQLWHLINVPVDEYQTYTKEDGEYGWTKDEYFQNYLNTEIETLKGEGMSNEEIGIKLFHKGMRTLNDSGLIAKTK
jgi:hypothetical protein